MPVTVWPAHHPGRLWENASPAAHTALDLLEKANPSCYQDCKELLQSSFNKIDAESPICAKRNGFVFAAIDAYNQHLHLKIRPEDVWFCILSQLSAYINKNAEELRTFFVHHQGQKELVVKSNGNRFTAPIDWMAREMSNKIGENMIDPELRDWVIPQFSTTTLTDQVVASVIFMGAMQNYFSYRFELSCGIPSVTLLGTRADWEVILERLEKIPRLGEEPTQFYELLKPVAKRFIQTFDVPGTSEVRDFWHRIAHQHSGGSGPTYLSGWITAFCFWDVDGKSLRARFGTGPPPIMRGAGPNSCLSLDGAAYHHLNTNDIPTGQASVPVVLDDNGQIFDTMLVAGSVGYQVSSSGEPAEMHRQPWVLTRAGEGMAHSANDWQDKMQIGLDSLQPISGWWMFVKQEKRPQQEEENEGERLAKYPWLMSRQKYSARKGLAEF
jgi:Domain of unknown function (DUF4419)